MTLPELIATLGPVAGVAMFMWLNRAPQKAGSPDPIIQKLDALIAAQAAQTAATEKQNASLADFAKTLAILMDRSDR